jgi:hypothetical protein
VIADRPGDIGDQCSDGTGTVISDHLCPTEIVPVYGTPRTVAGEPITTDQNACQLVPLNRNAYAGIAFTAAEWETMEQTFSSGVCDYSEPGISQQPTVAWQTYQTASGKVIYGGRPMGAPPVSMACTVTGSGGACVVRSRRRHR